MPRDYQAASRDLVRAFARKCLKAHVRVAARGATRDPTNAHVDAWTSRIVARFSPEVWVEAEAVVHATYPGLASMLATLWMRKDVEFQSHVLRVTQELNAGLAAKLRTLGGKIDSGTAAPPTLNATSLPMLAKIRMTYPGAIVRADGSFEDPTLGKRALDDLMEKQYLQICSAVVKNASALVKGSILEEVKVARDMAHPSFVGKKRRQL